MIGQTRHRACTTLIAALAIACCPRPLTAVQLVRGRVVEAGSEKALTGVVVRVREPGGAQLSSGLTTSTGTFQLSAPAGRPIQVFIETIGHEAWTSRTVSLYSADTLTLRVRLPVLPIALEEIQSEVRNRCSHATALPRVTAQMWQEVKKSLAAESLNADLSSLRYFFETFERETLVDSQLVVRDRRHRATTRRLRPFRPAPLEYLDEAGFFERRASGAYLLGPTTDVLLDDWFEDTHCLGLTYSKDTNEVGVRFEPNSERRQPDINGTLWLDAATYELKRASFTYINLPAEVPTGSSGLLEFRRLAGGLVLVNRWVIRNPIVELSEIEVFGQRRPVERVSAMLESGGEVLLAMLGSDTAYKAPRGAVSGVVWDSVNGLPLEHARVQLDGTSYESFSDSSGYYRIWGVPDGNYEVSFEHPRVETFGYRPVAKRVEIEPGSTRTVDLSIPATARVLVSTEDIARLDSISVVMQYLGVAGAMRAPTPEESQRASVPRGRPATILGRVVEHTSGERIQGAVIQLIPVDSASQSGPVTARSDRDGFFALRSVPAGMYEVVASKEGYAVLEPRQIGIEQGLEYDWVIRLQRIERQLHPKTTTSRSLPRAYPGTDRQQTTPFHAAPR